MVDVGTILLPFLTGGRPQTSDSFKLALVELGFNEPSKTMTNLTLLVEALNDAALVAQLAAVALDCSDPDMALNNLERCCDVVGPAQLLTSVSDPHHRHQLMQILGGSSFLTAILCRNANYLYELFGKGEVDRCKNTEIMHSELLQQLPFDANFDQLKTCLRRYKYREVLRIGARDLSGVADLIEVTAELSSLAAATLRVACRHCEQLMQAEYGLPYVDADDDGQFDSAPELATFTVLGMGKLGGWELNFSSDIDLIYFYSSSRGTTSGVTDSAGDIKNKIELHNYFIKLAERLTKAIGQVTADGFVFRVDLDLRPEGRSGEMACSVAAAESYYESWGQNWERSAMMKARPVAGSLELGEQLLKALQPFIYRRYLDYGMVDDLKQMKRKIDSHQSQHKEFENNLKLGKGGIREIEFFIQALQLVFAGKNPLVRERSTLRALCLLRDEGHVPAEDAQALRQAYIFLRTVEHRIQVVQERQTHNLPTTYAELVSLARRCGFDDYLTFRQTLDEHRDQVIRIYRGLFYVSEDETDDEIRPIIRFILDDESDSDLVKDVLEENGFRHPDAAYESLLCFREGKFGNHMTRRSRRYYARVLPLIVQAIIDSPEPDMAFNNFEEFLLRVRGHGTLYALLAENVAIIELLVSLFSTSTFLSRIFIKRPEILDLLVSSYDDVGTKSREVLADELAIQMADTLDYEDKLDTLRRFRNEEFLRIALNDLRGDVLQGRSLMQLSNLALVCLNSAVEIAKVELIPRFGLPFCQSGSGSWHEAEFAVLGMGKLGGMEINYHSDLDIIFMYSGQGKTRAVAGTDPDRFKQLSNQEYFSKLAQRIISVLSLATREGRVYEIDTRLRPSGNQGPLVTSLTAYETYHQSSAQLWERQALTKAKVVVGSPKITARINQINERITWQKELPAEFQSEIYRLRQRMEKEIAREGLTQFNIKTGRGGMVDVEFLVQYFQLLHGAKVPAVRKCNTLAALRALREQHLLAVDEVTQLSDGYKFLRRVENKLRLVHDQSFNLLDTNNANLRKLARRLGYPDEIIPPEDQFFADYKRVTEQIRTIFNSHLCPESSYCH